MSFLTTDLCDANEQLVRIAAPIFRSFGANPRFSGQIVTLKLFEDNTLVRATLGTPGHGKVLVVDGGGSLRCALLGDLLGAMAVENGWAGLVIHGCIRDSVAINQLPLGVRALATHPKKSFKRGEGERDLSVTFAGIDFVPGQWLYADEDGLIVSPQPLI